jgi:hypothetical protein
MTRSLTVVAAPVVAAEGFVWQVSVAVLLALRAGAWRIVAARIVERRIAALLGAEGIPIAERRSVPQQ